MLRIRHRLAISGSICLASQTTSVPLKSKNEMVSFITVMSRFSFFCLAVSWTKSERTVREEDSEQSIHQNLGGLFYTVFLGMFVKGFFCVGFVFGGRRGGARGFMTKKTEATSTQLDSPCRTRERTSVCPLLCAGSWRRAGRRRTWRHQPSRTVYLFFEGFLRLCFFWWILRFLEEEQVTKKSQVKTQRDRGLVSRET